MHAEKRSINTNFKLLKSSALGFAVLLASAPTVFAAGEVTLGAASDFALLSVAADGGGAVTCTDTVVAGNVGSTGPLASVTQVGCTITGAVVAPVSDGVVTDFYNAYDALAGQSCDYFLTNLDGQVLQPGTYCFSAGSTTTDGVLTLDGGASDTWLFKIGTAGTGALTGTNFDVVLSSGALACNVTWWVADAVTMTTSDFNGTILAGAAITMTGGSAESLALATAGVTLTNMGFAACDGGTIRTNEHNRCNQGVGNGAEGCDPGNSNQGNPSRTNDELGGTPGNPGRKKS